MLIQMIVIVNFNDPFQMRQFFIGNADKSNAHLLCGEVIPHAITYINDAGRSYIQSMLFIHLTDGSLDDILSCQCILGKGSSTGGYIYSCTLQLKQCRLPPATGSKPYAYIFLAAEIIYY